MYRIFVYNNTGTGTPIALLTKAVVRGWTKRINASGTMTFSLPISDTSATSTNLQKYRQVRLQRLKRDGTETYQTVWSGYIEVAKENGEFIDVICQGLLSLFKKRLTQNNQNLFGPVTDAAGLLTTTNGTDGDTGITVGSTISSVVFTADSATDFITKAAHGLANNSRIRVSNSGGALPTGLTAATDYYIVNATTNTFQVSLTTGGAVIDITTNGTGTNSYDLYRKITTQGRVDILRAWEDLAQAYGAEFEVDDTGAFNFVTSLGSDKSATVTLKFRRDGSPGTNTKLVNLGEDGAPMANRIIGYTNAGTLTSTKNDATSQATYPVLIEAHQFNEAQDQGTLDAVTQSYLTQRASPISDYRAEPILAASFYDPITGTQKISGLQYGAVVVGDLILCDFVTENQTVQQAKRVAEIDVTVDEQEQEQVAYTLSKSGVFITSGFLDAGIVQELRRTIKELEAKVN